MGKIILSLHKLSTSLFKIDLRDPIDWYPNPYDEKNYQKDKEEYLSIITKHRGKYKARSGI